jgi:hypothetical protein
MVALTFSSRAAWLTAGPMTVKSRRWLGADVAEHHLADVERDAEAQGRLLSCGAPDVERGNRSHGSARGPHCARGGFTATDTCGGKHCQHAVAHEFEDLARLVRQRFRPRPSPTPRYR